MKKNDTSGLRFYPEIEDGIVREPFREVVQKIQEAVCKFRNNFSVKTDGVLTKESEQISKVTITVEIFTR